MIKTTIAIFFTLVLVILAIPLVATNVVIKSAGVVLDLILGLVAFLCGAAIRTATAERDVLSEKENGDNS